MSPMTLSSMHDNGSQDSQNWLQSSVQTFFATCNWDDQSIEIQALKLSSLTASEAELTFSLSVHQFFAAVNWDGNSLNAPAPALENAVPQSSESDTSFTLTDFSDLF